MNKTVTIAGIPVELKATGSTLLKYRNWFGRDLIDDFKAVTKEFASDGSVSGEAFDIVAKLTYTMAKQADKSIPNDLEEWLDQFETFPISDFAADVVTFWASTLQSNSEVKNA